jgi:rod shape-determining protein MreC
MRNLIAFLVKNTHWWLFVLLVSVSFTLIVKNNAYQRNIYLSSANEISGNVYDISSSVVSYIGLRKANDALLDRMAALETHVQRLETYIQGQYDTTAYHTMLERSGLHSGSEGCVFIPARVVNNSVSRVDNYITLNKGRADGVEPDMGVIASTGVIGVVSLVSDHYAVVIPILNSKSFISCKILHTNHFGPLTWDGKSPRFAFLNNVPRHIDFNAGDTIVSSGFSDMLPENMLLGTVVASEKTESDEFSSLKILLSSDFQALKDVLIIGNESKKEQRELEGGIKK